MTDLESDTRAFRNALGRFATGVTVVTTRTAEGVPLGLTVSSFNTVSLAPPLVLWSLDRASSTLPVFEKATHFAVNVLGAGQVEVSNRFAGSDDDKFDGITCREGVAGIPILPDCVATFECRTRYQYDGGDHVIFVGEVEAFAQRPGAALLFHDGRYCVAADHPGQG